MGCTPDSWPILEGGVNTLVFVGGTTITDCPIVGVCLVLDVTVM